MSIVLILEKSTFQFPAGSLAYLKKKKIPHWYSAGVSSISLKSWQIVYWEAELRSQWEYEFLAAVNSAKLVLRPKSPVPVDTCGE